MKNVSIYSSDFDDLEDWNNLLEELNYSEDEREMINEIELAIVYADVPESAIMQKQY